MEINRIDLLKALEIVKPGLANKELVEQSTSFAFMGDKIVTYNDDISIAHPIKGLELTGAIKAEKLYQILGKFSTDTVTMDIKGSEILLKSGRAKAGLTLQQEIKLPLEEEIAYKEKWKELPKQFLEGIDLAMPCASRNMSRPVLTCIHIRKDGIIESSDDLRVMQYTMSEKMPLDNILLPVPAAVVMYKLKPTKVAKGNGWIHFKNEAGTVLSCRVFSDKFPNTDPILDMKGTKFTLPKEIAGVLDRAAVFAKRDHMLDETVQITLESKKLKMKGESESGWFEESVDMDYKGEEVEFFITPYLLKGIINQSLEGRLVTNRLKFKGPNWVYVSALKALKK